MSLGAPQAGDAATWLRLWGVAALSPAACEELLFRGFLLQALQRARPPDTPPGQVPAGSVKGLGQGQGQQGQAQEQVAGNGVPAEAGPSLGRIDAVFVAGETEHHTAPGIPRAAPSHGPARKWGILVHPSASRSELHSPVYDLCFLPEWVATGVHIVEGASTPWLL